jgi:putative PIN family toxin of toxin-antitoxin system
LIRATLDVNVLASGFPAETGPPAALIDHWTNLDFELILSEHILNGLARAWQKPYFRQRYRHNQIEATLSLLRTEATLVIPVTNIRGVAADLEDDLVLATAIAGDANFLVTGDRYLQALVQYRNTIILSPRQFLDVLAEERGDPP